MGTCSGVLGHYMVTQWVFLDQWTYLGTGEQDKGVARVNNV